MPKGSPQTRKYVRVPTGRSAVRCAQGAKDAGLQGGSRQQDLKKGRRRTEVRRRRKCEYNPGPPNLNERSTNGLQIRSNVFGGNCRRRSYIICIRLKPKGGRKKTAAVRSFVRFLFG